MKFRCYPGSSHAQSLFFNGTEYDNWDSMYFIDNLLKVDDRFIDIGANVGIFHFYLLLPRLVQMAK